MPNRPFPEPRTVLTAIAVVEALYAAAALLTPPSLILPLTGWVLSPDGQWLVKLLGAALGFQAWVAWALRDSPHRGIAWGLAAYQFAAATIDWVMWMVLAGDGVFSTPLAQLTVGASIVIHYALGILLVLALRRSPQPA
jgi:hypothetical protein